MPTALKIVQHFYPEITKVVDATKPLAVVVTPNDVKNGKPKAHCDCALAVAFERQTGGRHAIVSTRSMFEVPKNKKGTAIRHQMPPNLYAELVAFDRGAPMTPGTYRLTVPTVRVGKKARKTGRGHSPGQSRSKHRRAPGLRPMLGQL